ncbi:uncharacterized protein [Haliotis asinina]|uniref:uncharacterized protein n=1 Tax=Haliotis asinina TaxID=109174 RepID=UPI0035320964
MMLKITVLDLLLLILYGVQSTEAEHVCTESCKESFFPCTGCLLPVNPYGFFGRNVTLNCTLLYENSSSSSLYYTWKKDELLPAEYQTVISPSTLQLNMPVIDNDAFKGTLMIQCLNNNSHPFPDMTGIQVLTVDYPPHVSNLSAICLNWKSLKFTWGERYKNEADVNVTAIWTAQGTDWWFRCNDNMRMSCLIDNITSSEYTINITATNIKVGETYSTSLTVRPDKVVKPASVTSLMVSSWTSCCVTLTWNHNQLSVKEMNFSVVTMLDGSEVRTEMSVYNNQTLCGLRPATRYTFLVSAMSAAGGFWSDPESINQTTREDVPSHGANLTGGNFLTQACNSKKQRRVKLYLKPPDKQYHNGILKFFTVLAVPADGSSNISKHNIAISYSTVELYGLKCNVSYSVEVSVSTAVGPSIPTKMIIPKEGVVEPPTIVRVPYDSRSVWVEWKSGVTPQHWTVVWCKGDHDICEDDLDWLIVDGKNRSAAVPFTKPAGVTFAVSMTTAKGVSSKLTWSSCFYDVNNIPENKPSVPSVNTQPALGLTVMWLPDMCPEQTLITHYVIEHCVKNYTDCKSNTVPSDHNSLVIKNLKEGINYSVRLKPVAGAGEGPASDPVYAVPIDPSLSTGDIVGIAFACFFVVIVILSGMVCCYRYSRKKWNEKEKIIIPALPNFPADSATNVSTVAFMPLSETKCVERPKQTHLLTDRQLSGDSGRGSLTGGDLSPAPLSLSNQSLLKFEPVDEKEELAKQGSGSELRSSCSLPRDYTKVADEGSSGHQSITCLCVDKQDNPWNDSDESLDEESFNNKGYDEYVIAANRDGGGEEEKGVNPGFVPDGEGKKSESDAVCQVDSYQVAEDCHGVPFTEDASDITEVEVTDGLSTEMSGVDSFCDELKVLNAEHQSKSLAGGISAGADVDTLKSHLEKSHMSQQEHSDIDNNHMRTQPEVPYMALQGENHSYLDDSHQRTQPGVAYTSCQESSSPQMQSDTVEPQISIPVSKDEMTRAGEMDEGLGSCSSSYSSDSSRG